MEGCFNGGKERGRERERGEYEIEGIKEGEKWNFEVCFIRFLFIKVIISVIYVFIYRLGSFFEKFFWENFFEKFFWENFFEKLEFSYIYLFKN